MTLEHYIPEEDNKAIDEICGYSQSEGIQLAVRMEVEILIADIGLVYDEFPEDLRDVEKTLRNGVISESVKLNRGEDNEYDLTFSVYQKVCIILNQ